MKKLAILVLTLSAVSGCGLFGGGKNDGMAASSGGSKADVEAAIKDAEAAIDKSAGVAGEWRDARGKILKAAKDAAAKGDNDEALKLAQKAKFEGEMGYQQALEQKEAKPWLF